MITPSFSLTATERVLPKLALDFTTASLDPRVTFTRALNTATVTNSSGNVVTINANLPRFDYNPVTLACKGLLIEESRVNSFIYSEDFNSWTTKNNVTISSASVTSPAGTQTGDTITGNAGTSAKYVAQTVSLSAAPTISVYVKAAGQNFIQILNATEVGGYANFDITAGAGAVGSKGATVSASSITDAGNGWYRITASFTIATGSVGFRIYFANSATAGYNPSSSSTGSVYFWGAQIESGTFPTSYIPNLATGTTTRNADIATMTGTNFSDWYNATQGSLKVVYQYNSGLTGTPISISDGTTANRVLIYKSGANMAGFVGSGGALQANMVTNAATTAVSKAVIALKQDNFAFEFNANGQTTDTSGLMPVSPNIMNIGAAQGATSTFNGWILQVYYYIQRLTANEVKAFSKQ